MKKAFRFPLILLLTAMLMLLLQAGCAAPNAIQENDTPLDAVRESTQTGAPDDAQSMEQSSTNTSGEAYENKVEAQPVEAPPNQIEITVTREGFPETYMGTLAISSRFGYAIYMLPDFEFSELDDYDYVAPQAGSPVSPTINMQIYEVDITEPVRDEENMDDEYWDIIISQYRRVALGERVIEVRLDYPLEASGAGAVILHAMADTIQSF